MSFFVSENIKSIIDEESYYNTLSNENNSLEKKKENINTIESNELVIQYKNINYEINKIEYHKNKIFINFNCTASNLFKFMSSEINLNIFNISCGKNKNVPIDVKSVILSEVNKSFIRNCYNISIIIDCN